MSKYVPWQPTAKQTAGLLLDDVLELLYGGAAGGGKSVWILMEALQYMDVPYYAALIIRKTFSDLSKPGALMDLAMRWLVNTDAHWDRDKKTWTFPSGATLTFGYLESENDKHNYQGSAYQFIGFDELTQHSEEVYLYLFSRLRKPDDIANYPQLSEVPLRMRATSNPGGKYHDWVKERFIDSIKRYPEIRKERMFIPAKLTDNKYINQEEYIKSLNNLDIVTREQLLNGNWEIRPSGGLFKRDWLCFVDDIPKQCLWVRAWDLAATLKGDYSVGILMGELDGVYYVRDMQRQRGTPMMTRTMVKNTAEIDGRGIQVSMEQEPGSAGVNNIDVYARQVLQGFNFKGVRSTGDKVTRAQIVSSAMEHGNLKILRGNWNRDFVDELIVFPQGEHDDIVDACSLAMSELNRLKSGDVYMVGKIDFELTSYNQMRNAYGRQANQRY